MMKQALLAFGTDPHQAMPPIQHLRKLSGARDALQPPFSSNERRKSTLCANNDYLAQNQTFSHNQ